MEKQMRDTKSMSRDTVHNKYSYNCSYFNKKIFFIN